MKWFITLTVLVIAITLSAVTAADLSGRIIIDGYSSDFTTDEYVLSDSTGIPLEYPNDSRWGENNDIRQIRVTWDQTYLYVAVDATSWDNNVILFIDVYDDYGIDDMEELNTWNREFRFYNVYPDFFLATWDTNNNPQFWEVREGLSDTADEWGDGYLGYEDFATFNTGSSDRALEAKIPWAGIYYSDERSMLNYPTIKFLAVITGGGDHTAGPDSAPDNLSGMPDQTETVVLDNYVEVPIDQNGDGEPDMGVLPNYHTSFFKRPPFEAQSLKVERVIFDDGKVFAPTRGEKLTFSLETNRGSIFSVEIFNLDGKKVGTAASTGNLEWEWTGRDQDGNLVNFGVYILRFIADSKEVSHKEAVVLIK